MASVPMHPVLGEVKSSASIPVGCRAQREGRSKCLRAKSGRVPWRLSVGPPLAPWAQSRFFACLGALPFWDGRWQRPINAPVGLTWELCS